MIQHPAGAYNDLHGLHANRPQHVVVHELVVGHFVGDALAEDSVGRPQHHENGEDETTASWQLSHVSFALISRMRTLRVGSSVEDSSKDGSMGWGRSALPGGSAGCSKSQAQGGAETSTSPFRRPSQSKAYILM
jgi:hypothetical protein|eukprot:569406-Prymnesium_polylepis.1